ncbi:MAG: metallophosphoesterase [Deltaproteobacteria bacterium]|nr:metallophosphoesterase [Deltaproteobacteria bacterium]
MVKEGAELVIFPGDLVNGWYAINTPYADQFATWRKAMAPAYDAGIKVYPVRGNHEDGPWYALKNRLIE